MSDLKYIVENCLTLESQKSFLFRKRNYEKGVGVSTCITLVLCGVALVGYLLAARNFIKQCINFE
jgi:hypothetical protein